MSAAAEKQPRGSGWQRAEVPMHVALASVGSSGWRYGRIYAISTLVEAELPDGSGRRGPQWHISISRSGKRPSAGDVRKALRSFGLVGAEEDNHHPGVARHFWRPVDPGARVDCECKTTEELIVEPDGYRWTNPTSESGEPCRGCEHVVVTGQPCPIHAPAEVTDGP